MEEDVENISQYAFCNCPELKSLTLSEGLITIGGDAFEKCPKLERVTFPASVQQIEGGAFARCEALTEITVENPDIVIGEWAFASTGLKTVYFRGSEEQWKKIVKKEESSALKNAEVVYLDPIPVKPGDTDRDGTVTAADARLALRTAVGLRSVLSYSTDFQRYDVDHDRTITAADARLILRAAVGLEDPQAW